VSPVLEIGAVSKRFGDVHALEDVTFSVDRGEVVAVIGPNGAGKTTLLSILAGSLSPTSGRVVPEPDDVGWAPQQPAIYSRLSVAENLQLFARLEGVEDSGAAVARMLDQTGLRERASERIGRLSGGNRQRVNVALALISEPPVLALDEPSASLDPAQRERLWHFIADLAEQGTTVLFSTHNVGEAQRYAARTVVLADGRLIFDGAPAELMARMHEDDGDFERALVAFLEQHARTGAPESARP
jgi:ABC-2 type transport system ATP-binding protein